jgi:hypothetical protein
MNEPTLPDALDRRIEEALRRRFPAPAALGTLAERARPRRGARQAPWTALAAAAAVLLGLLWWGRARTADGPASAPGPDPLVEHAPAPTPAAFCRVVGPVVEGVPGLGAFQSPDLARLYHDMDACQESSESTACGQGDDLAQRLSATYGQPLELRPEAAGLLHGPFGSQEWPTGTIVTGRAGGETSVLVADLGTTLECCVRMRLPEDSGLQLFTWQVGELVLTEITPSREPRLIAYFE